MDDDKQDHLKSVLRHIDHVRESCLILGERLIELGEGDCGLELIANGQVHDNSKLSGIEWEHLTESSREDKPELFLLALKQHWDNNAHHPEHWAGSIKDMPRVFLAEMVCDVKSRASEFGTDIRDWIKDELTKKYELSKSGREYKEIKDLLDILLEKGFKK